MPHALNNFSCVNNESTVYFFSFGGFLTAHFFIFNMSETHEKIESHVKPPKKNSLIQYFQDSFEELKKVTWPTRNQAIKLTFIVIGFCLVFSVFVGALDEVFNYGYIQLVAYSQKVAPQPASTTNTTTAPVATGEPTSSVDLSKIQVPAVTPSTTPSTTPKTAPSTAPSAPTPPKK